MPIPRLPTYFLLFLVLMALPCAQSLRGQNVPETWSILAPAAKGNCQYFLGPTGLDTPTIGLIGSVSQAGEPLRVVELKLTPSGPASFAGVQVGDLIWGANAVDQPIVIDACGLLNKELTGSGEFALFIQHPGQQERSRITVHPKPRREVYPAETQLAWKIISEFVDGGRFRVTAALARGSQGDFELRLGFHNLQSASLLQLDESKIFLLDDRGTEFSHQPFPEWERNLQTIIARANALAEGMESVPYTPPAPPPPPTHYHISSTVDGNYTLTEMGAGTHYLNGQSQVDSTVSPEYTPSEQIQQATQNITSLLDAIRVARTNKEIQKLRQRAAANAAAGEKMLAAGRAAHLDTTALIAPGARRTGAVAFVEPKNLDAGSITAVLVVTDVASKKDYFVNFKFSAR